MKAGYLFFNFVIKEETIKEVTKRSLPSFVLSPTPFGKKISQAGIVKNLIAITVKLLDIGKNFKYNPHIMKCPFCSCCDTKVLDSRPNDDKTAIRRRRECESCHRRFTTYEKIETIPIMVLKKDGNTESYDRGKIERGILQACYKRHVTREKIEQVVDEIENEIFSLGCSEVKSSVIGEIVMDKIKEVDSVAYVRFASVYRQFKDVNTFIEEIKKLC